MLVTRHSSRKRADVMAPPPLDERPPRVAARDDELFDFPSERNAAGSVRSYLTRRAAGIKAWVALLLSSRPRLRVPVFPSFPWESLVDGRAGIAPVVVFAFLSGMTLGAVVFGDSDESPPSTVMKAAAAPAPHVDAPVAVAQSQLPINRIAYNAAAGAQTAIATPQVFRGSLSIDSRPAGAIVYINGRSAGRTPLRLSKQVVGSRAIQVAAEGFNSSSTAIQIVSGRETRVHVELKPSATRIAR